MPELDSSPASLMELWTLDGWWADWPTYIHVYKYINKYIELYIYIIIYIYRIYIYIDIYLISVIIPYFIHISSYIHLYFSIMWHMHTQGASNMIIWCLSTPEACTSLVHHSFSTDHDSHSGEYTKAEPTNQGLPLGEANPPKCLNRSP